MPKDAPTRYAVLLSVAKDQLRSRAGFQSRILNYCPLAAAIWAPVSTLLDIPALTEHWFYLNGSPAPDPAASLILSGFSLAFNAIANALLVARFSLQKESRWKFATSASVVCWVIKLIFALVNLCVYGALSRNSPGYSYAEGFWCAVVSVIIAGIIAILLLCHYFLKYDSSPGEGDNVEIRVAGRHFMLSVISLLSLLAIEALIFSQIEKWTYLDGIYYALVTGLTIGFGDFQPTWNVTRVLLFPFAVLSIALLAVQVGVIVEFISSRTDGHKAQWRANFEAGFRERKMGAAGEKEKPLTLVEEVGHLQDMQLQEQWYSRIFDLFTSVCSLIVFWMVGAAVFMAIEGWQFGSAVYFCYVFFLTIGYGDFTPSTPAGRVVFIVYALMAVPVVTSFVVQTVTGLIGSIADRNLQKSHDKRALTTTEQKPFHSHAYYTTSAHDRLASEFPSNHRNDATKDTKELTRLVLDLAVLLEEQSRSLLIDHLEPGSKSHVLLRADRNLQLRALKNLSPNTQDDSSESAHSQQKRYREGWLRAKAPFELEKDAPTTNTDKIEEQESPHPVPGLRKLDALEQVRRYRETYASLLAAGSRLLELEGDDKWRFERRLEGEDDDNHGGMLLGDGRMGPAERYMGVDV